MKSFALYSVLICLQFLVNYALDTNDIPSCDCDQPDWCKPVTTWNEKSKEVIILTNNGTQYKKWLWQSITTVVTLQHNPSKELMCYAHSQGVKYGIKREIIADYNYTSAEVTEHIRVTKELVKLARADVLMLDLMPLLGNCNNAKEHVESIMNVTSRVITEIKQPGNLRVVCVVPWKPPCYDSECMVAPSLAKYCDAIEVNPDSFINYCNDACIARATVPYSRMQMGLLEYEASGFRPHQIMMGVPWHGYNYTCDKFESVNSQFGRNVCTLARLPTNSSSAGSCGYEQARKRVDIEEFSVEHPTALVSGDNHYDTVDQAPYGIYIEKVTEGNTTVEKVNMGWFENIASLFSKYELVNKMDLGGIVVYTGDDLTYSSVPGEALDGKIWAWVYHTMLSTGTPVDMDKEPDYAAIVAGVGVSMFCFGTLLGVIFACIFFRRKKNLKQPFHSDPDVPEFYDEDQNL